MSQYVICAFYKFVSLPDYEALRQSLLQEMKTLGVKGTVLLAEEGLNGTIAGSQEGIDAILGWFKADARLTELEYKLAHDDQMPFERTKVRLKKEIVTLGVEGIDPNQEVGTYINPADWNALISDPEVLLIDTRNDYEVQIGTFKNAINPGTEAFREFPQYVEENLDPQQHKKVAMFCTGGIRCEKATSFLKSKGFEEVFHLQGGILKYLEEIPKSETLWEGECFVFDGRVAVNHQLGRGQYEQCNACGYPITEDDKKQDTYVQGVSCPHCYDAYSAGQKARFAEREKQLALAAQRGEAHMGPDVARVVEQRRKAKQDAKRRQQEAS